MGGKIYLLFVMLVSTVNGQSTEMPIGETVLVNTVEESKPPSSAEAIQGSGATVEYTFAGNEGEKKNTEKPDNVITTVQDEDNDLMFIERLINGDMDDVFKENRTGEHGDDTGVNYSPDILEDAIEAANSDKVEVKSPGETTGFGQASTPVETFAETKENSEYPQSASTPFESVSDQVLRTTPNFENSPLLQLTQGGYQRPFQTLDRFRDQPRRLRSESATQQAETIRTLNEERSGKARVSPQTSYSSPFQPPFRFTPGSAFRSPFAHQMNVLRSPNGAYQNSFYNTQPDFGRGQYSQIENPSELSPAIQFAAQSSARTPMQNLGYVYQSPFQVPSSPPMPYNAPAPMPSFFHPGGSPAFSNYDNGMALPGNDFSALFGNTGPANPQFQDSANLYGSSPNFERNIFTNPGMNVMQHFPNSDEGLQFSPRFLNHPLPERQLPIENPQEERTPESSSNVEKEKSKEERMDETPKEGNSAAPFGTRIQKPNSDEQERSNFERRDNVYMRYPMTEAGYATEENLPEQNGTDKKITDTESPLRPSFPFFNVPRRYNVYKGLDPYKIALENVRGGYPNSIDRKSENKNGTEESGESEPENLEPERLRPEPPTQMFRAYPERNPELSIPNVPFYVNADPNPFEPMGLFPENNYRFSPRPPRVRETNKTPACAEKSNVSLCFEDKEYPRGEVMYALNSDSFLMDRLVMPEQQLEGIPLVEQNTTETPQSEDNYICKSDIKYGLPLRAQNIRGHWKVIINMERAVGRGKFVQPVRLEICRGAGEPCSFTQVKTTCVQKYSLQRLLSWSLEKGVHNDVYKIPVACSCQIVDAKA